MSAISSVPTQPSNRSHSRSYSSASFSMSAGSGSGSDSSSSSSNNSVIVEHKGNGSAKDGADQILVVETMMNGGAQEAGTNIDSNQNQHHQDRLSKGGGTVAVAVAVETAAAAAGIGGYISSDDEIGQSAAITTDGGASSTNGITSIQCKTQVMSDLRIKMQNITSQIEHHRKIFWFLLGLTMSLLLISLGGTVTVYQHEHSEHTDVDQWLNLALVTLVGALVLLGCISFVFAHYQKYAHQRHEEMILESAKSSAIVTSMFPSAVRDRLYQDFKYTNTNTFGAATFTGHDNNEDNDYNTDNNDKEMKDKSLRRKRHHRKRNDARKKRKSKKKTNSAANEDDDDDTVGDNNGTTFPNNNRNEPNKNNMGVERCLTSNQKSVEKNSPSSFERVGSTHSEKLQSYLHGGAFDGALSGAPIADLFPHCTVLFAGKLVHVLFVF